MRNYSERVLAAMAEIGPVRTVRTQTELPANYLYMVSNGLDVLQVGKGSGKRMSGCMRGSLAIKHNKAFICAIGEMALGEGGSNQYFVVETPGKAAANDAEQRVHESLGITTNRTAACLINGCTSTDIPGVSAFLWSKIVTHARYLRLSEKERLMAQELFELVTIPKRENPRAYAVPLATIKGGQGDFLEGHILRKIGASYLIRIFEKLTDGYLRYESHRPSDQEYEAMLACYGDLRKAA